MQYILVVEDSPSINLMYKKLFTETNGWASTFSVSFEEAINLVSENSFDYIISDGLLIGEEMNGIEFLTKAKYLSPDTARLLISGSIYPKEKDYQSFNAFIDKKDLNGQELLELINVLAKENEMIPDKFYKNVFLS